MMLSGRGSWFNLLNMDDYSISDRTRIPRVVSVPGIISDFENAEPVSPIRSPERRIVVSNLLPVKAFSSGRKWRFEWDRDALVFQMKDGFSPDVEVVFVGCLRVEIDALEQEEVSQILFENFRCVPTFLPSDLMNKYYHGFCKRYLWPLFHYMMPLLPTNGVKFDNDAWKSYVSANKIFADKVTEVLSPNEDSVWLHDYHLMILPTFLRRKFHRVKLGFFLHSPFPSSEIYRTLPVRGEILRALLNCDLLGFHTFDYARHFLSCCRRLLGLEHESKRGYIGLEYFGRTVTIKILPVGIHREQILSAMEMPETVKKVHELKDKYKGKILFLGVDDLDIFKGISLKFRAFGRFLEENPMFRGNVVLVQIINVARSGGDDVKVLQDEINGVATGINQMFGNREYLPIVCVNGPVSFEHKVAYYSLSYCVVVTPVRDGMNLVPYKYTVCRQGSPDLDKVIGNQGCKKSSVIIVSEFIGCSPSLSGAIRVNPWDVDGVADAMFLAIAMTDSEKELRHEKHYKYVASHDVAYWVRSFEQDLDRACSGHYKKRCWGIGFGLNFRVVALSPNFRKLSMELIFSAYKTTSNRLILLDYDGTMMPQDQVDKSPTPEVISVLCSLCSNPNNTVFVVSGRGKDSLEKWFSQCNRLGLSAEHGYFTRWIESSEWEPCSFTVDFDWKNIALPVMEHYTEATDGSFIEQKESALVWHYQEADPDFGSWQAKQLLDHLENVLANDPVVVKSGQQIVEVKPQCVSKGMVVKDLLTSTRKAADFVLCIGDDRSDEDMFEALMDAYSPDSGNVFACTVGQKPSMAKYYVDDTQEVIRMLQGLATSK